MIAMSLKVNHPQMERLRKKLKIHGAALSGKIARHWNEECNEFAQFMKGAHLEGGTLDDRLARRSSNLWSGIHGKAKADPYGSKYFARGWVTFVDAVQHYAIVHEYGSRSRNIPARMNLRREWRGWQPKFVRALETALKEASR